MENQYICIHGHFYQPPRENPWLDEVEVQESAFPYHDWNERVTAECYARNTASRILDHEKRIAIIINNYSKISFNFGATLLSWMEKKKPEIYEAILEADRISQKSFSGHGSAIAQVYNHLIMPLANSRDKRTQIIWGIKDFEHRFKRMPEGMWLAETAVDLESLDIMAELGIKFSILAPYQAKRFRENIKDAKWKNASGDDFNLNVPYLCKLPSGRTISLFFYNGQIAQAVAFQGLLNNGEEFAQRLKNAIKPVALPQMVHIATDGESYGHHHKFGDMALAYCAHYLESKSSPKLSVYGEFLGKFPPVYEVEINENTSWSCAHGVERWRSNCSCAIGQGAGWHQKWRGPLRDTLDWLRDELAKFYEKEISSFGQDPWRLRNDYIAVVLDRREENVSSFIKKNFAREFSQDEKIKIIKMLEMQLNTQLMYTSCGWFFDDISGLESTQIIKYAARAMQLAKEAGAKDFEAEFVDRLKDAPSNIPEIQNGAKVYKAHVHPAVVDLLRVGAHYAMCSLFQEYAEEAPLYCYTVKSETYDRQHAGRMHLATGRVGIKSNVTWDCGQISFAVLHLGEHNIIAGVNYSKSLEDFIKMQGELNDAFEESDIPEIISLINKYFKGHNFSLWHLFRQEQQMILDKVLHTAMADVETSFRHIYDHHYPLMQIKDDIQLSLPRTFVTVVEFILYRDLHAVLEAPELDIERFGKLIEEIKRWPMEKEKIDIGFLGVKKIEYLMEQFKKNPDNIDLMQTMELILINLKQLNLMLDLWRVENIFFGIAQDVYRSRKLKNAQDGQSQVWLSSFENLANILQVKV